MSGPLGVYDSGIGGETIVREIKKTFPHISICYLKHTSLFPLGNKTKKQIYQGMEKATTILFEKNCPLVIIACNSASVASICHLQQQYIPKKYRGRNVLGVNIPIIELLNSKPDLKAKRGLILSTQFTASTGFYAERLKNYGFTKIQTTGVPGLADAIEENKENKMKISLDSALKIIDVKQVDFVVLACTHYPLAMSIIRNYFNPQTIMIDPSQWIAEKFREYLQKHREYHIEQRGKYEIIEA